MKIVVDASVALKWVLDEEGSEAADGLLDEELMAPSLWVVEAANALWRLSVRGELAEGLARAKLQRLGEAPVAMIPVERDLQAAAEIAFVLAHPVYDCLYLALAVREGTHVVTADRRFHTAASQFGRFAGHVRLLA